MGFLTDYARREQLKELQTTFCSGMGEWPNSLSRWTTLSVVQYPYDCL